MKQTLSLVVKCGVILHACTKEQTGSLTKMYLLYWNSRACTDLSCEYSPTDQYQRCSLLAWEPTWHAAILLLETEVL